MHRIQEKGTCPNDQDLKLVGTQSVYSWRANLKKRHVPTRSNENKSIWIEVITDVFCWVQRLGLLHEEQVIYLP